MLEMETMQSHYDYAMHSTPESKPMHFSRDPLWEHEWLKVIKI